MLLATGVVAVRQSVARRIAILVLPFFAGVAVSLALFGCCCPGRAMRGNDVPHPEPAPPIGLAHFDEPRDVVPAKHTQAEMHNVLFHVDRTIVLAIHTLRGEFFDKVEGQPLNFDNKSSFIVQIYNARIGVSGSGLTDLMNHYVFNYKNPPLRDLRIAVHEGRLVQQGVMHKIIDIPFEMTADVSVTDQGWLRIHPLDIRICDLNGKALMKAFDISLEKILEKLPEGVRVDENDLLIDALGILPPPVIRGRISDIELHEDELLQIFTSDVQAAAITPPDTGEGNWMFFQDGTLRMGKLFMVRGDMQVVDADPRDPFDFFVDHYNSQLSEGFTRNQPDYGLKVFMRDFNDVGKPRQAGERQAPD